MEKTLRHQALETERAEILAALSTATPAEAKRLAKRLAGVDSRISFHVEKMEESRLFVLHCR